MMSKLEWILRHRFTVFLASMAIIVLLASGARNLFFTTDYRVFFSKENPQLQAFEALQNTYTKNDNILFLVIPRSGNVFDRDTLAAIEDITARAWKIPYSIRVDSLTNFQYSYADGDELIVSDLFRDARQIDESELARRREVALHEPMLLNRIISPDATATGVNVTIQLPGKAQHLEVPEAAKYAEELAEQIRKDYPSLDVYMTGMVIMNNAFSEASKQDIETLVLASYGVIILMLFFMLRSVSATVVTVLLILSSIASAVGMSGWLGFVLSPPTTTAPTIITTIAVANSVHILMSFLYQMRRGMDKLAAIRESLRINLQPVFLTSLTTALGFLSMNFSDAPPFRTLGNIVALGVVFSFIWSVTLLPALIMLLPVRVKPQQKQGVFMHALADFVVEYRTRLIMAMGISIVVLVSFIPRNVLNDEFVKYFDETVEFRRHTDVSNERLTGIYQLEYSFPARGPGGISEPEYLRYLKNFTEHVRALPHVRHVASISDTMMRLNRNMHGDDESWYRLPDERPLAAQYLLLYELSLPFGLDLNNQVNVDKSSTRVSLTLENMSSNDVLDLEREIAAWMGRNLPVWMQTQAASSTLMFAHIGSRNIRSMLVGTSIALILISLVLIIALRSIRLGLVSMVPNLIPAAMAFGIWGIFVGKVGLALSVVTGMTLGIIVDDTVHFLSKYQRARREHGLDPRDAVRYAFTTVGTALVVTSVVLIAGFLILALSSFELNSSMGLMTAITILLALAADFLFLPPLLMKLEEKRDALSRH